MTNSTSTINTSTNNNAPTSNAGRFSGQVALVTGGGTGIGAATARRIAAEDGKVIVTGRRRALVERVAAETGGIAVAGDTTDPNHLIEAVQAAVDNFGGLDVLVANAATAHFETVEEISIVNWRADFNVNVDGAMLASKYAIPEMRRRGGGAIVLVASMAALTGAPRGAPYISSKAAMLGLNRSLAFDFGPEGIRSNVVCPGWVPTEPALDTLGNIASVRGCTVDELASDIVKHHPLRRMGAPDEIAAAITFLASKDASFITGTIMIADGGGAIVDVGTTALSG